MQLQIPNWIKIVSGLISALALFVGISLIAYNIMNLQDVFIGVANNDSSLVIGAFVFFLLSASMIFSMTQQEKRK